MIVKKQWKLFKKDLTEYDVKFVVGLGCPIRIDDQEPIELIGPNGNRYQYRGTTSITYIISTNTKQEAMLKLKFGDDLKLQQVVHTTPDTRTPFPL